MAQPAAPQSICERFNAYVGHDSKLFAMHLLHGREKRTGDLVLEVKLRRVANNWDDFQTAQLIIKGCTILRINLDVEAKAACSHDIGDAVCVARSALMEQLETGELKYETSPLAGFVHFQLALCPPGGEIHAIARDFEVKIDSKQ